MLHKILDSIHFVNRVTMRTFIKYSFNSRPTSHPYITGDGFRFAADHIYDNLEKVLNPEKIKKGDVVFIGDSRIKNFLKEVHPKITNPYIIVSNNGDEKIDEEVVSKIDDKIIKWYGINATKEHDKVISIPVGIGNKYYYVTGIPYIIRRFAKKRNQKINRIFYKFTTSTNLAERTPALEALQRNFFSDTTESWLNFPNYMKVLSGYKFVASPPGSSIAGHRTWEAMYIGVIPIVKSSIPKDYFEKLKMPLWVVKDWNELDNVDEEFLNKKYDSIMKHSNFETIYMNYWLNMIHEEKIKILSAN